MSVSGTDETLLPPLSSTLGAFPEVEPGAAAPAAGPPVGDERYEAGDVLGRGGMGTVYVAKDVQFGRQVALKQMHPDRQTPAASRRFVIEALVTGNLEHSGIPAVHERGEREGRPYYVMRRVGGRTLTDAVASTSRFEERLALLPAVVRVAHTLGFAHERGVVHRDVKPDNVVLGRHGETLLLDWGIARVRDAVFTEAIDEARDGAQGEQTVAGAVMGTPAYMAPEQAAGRLEEIDERTDVFALGAMLYFVLTGSPPYEGSSALVVLAAAADARAIPLARAAPRTSLALREIVEVAMARRPEDRYPNASAFADALQGFLNRKVHQRSSPVVRSMGTAIGLGATIVVASLSLWVSSRVSSFAQHGWSGWAYVSFPLLSSLLAFLDWRTKGRNHLAPLILSFSLITVLFGLVGAASGMSQVVATASDLPPEHTTQTLLRGTWEISGGLTLAGLAATIQLVLWALVKRVGLLARDETGDDG